jgi:signal transduction histidine kinase
VSFLKNLFALLLTFNCEILSAQSSTYYIQHFNNENGLMQNSIKGMEMDKKGYLWLATEMGAARYDGSNFKVYNRTNSPELTTDRIWGLGLMSDGNVFAEVAGRHFYIGNTGKLQSIPEKYWKQKPHQAFSISNTYSIYEKCKSKYERHEIPNWAVPDFQLISSSLLNSLVYIRGFYYYFNEKKDVISVDTNLEAFQKVVFTHPLPSNIIQNATYIPPISLIQSDSLLFLRWGEYIYELSFINESYISAKPVLRVGDIANITSFLKLPQQDIFVVGTMSDGFYIFQKQIFSSIKLKESESNIFYAQVPYGNDGVLTHRGVLSQHEHRPLSGFNSRSILKTQSGQYYLNKISDEETGGVVEFNDKLEELKFIPKKNLWVTAFRQLKDGSIWISTATDSLGKIENDKITWFKLPQSLPKEFIVSSFIEAGSNEFWLAGNKGLALVNVLEKTAYFVPQLNNVDVRNLYMDAKGMIWIGTYGNGYYCLNEGRLISMPLDNERFLAASHDFLVDSLGFMWISTNRGLFQASLKELYQYINGKILSVYYYYFDKTAGLPTNEFNGGCTPAGIRLNNGKFSLPTVQGLVQFDPDSIKPILPSAAIYVDAISGDTSNYDVNSGALKIPHSINHLRFHISSPYFGNSYNQSIEYRLKDFDDAWYRLNKNGIIDFSKLPTGAYRLELRKKAGFGENNYITREISLSIPPFFYETWLFKILSVVLLIVVIYSFFRFRIHFLSQQKIKLQKEVYEKTIEQKKLIDDLEVTISKLEKSESELYQSNVFKEELAMIITHDLQSPLRFISSATQRLYQSFAEKKYSEVEETSMELRKSSSNVYGFIEELTLWLSTMGKNFDSQNTIVNLYNLIADLRLFFNELLKEKGNKLEIDVDEFLSICTNENLFKIILRNVIDNANKHTSDGIIIVSGNIDHASAFVTVSDNGEGITAETLKKINSQINREPKNMDAKGSLHGHGYRFINQFCNLLNIHLEVQSVKGMGTSVRLNNLQLSGSNASIKQVAKNFELPGKP